MLTKTPSPSFSQFVLALQGYEQAQTTKRNEEKMFLEHAQAFFGRQGHEKNNQGGNERFNSRCRGFTHVGSYNVQGN